MSTMDRARYALASFRLATTILGLASGAESRADRLNVVVFVADDLGWRDLGCYGSSFHETPNLDRLAAHGARFTDAYAACPVCSPTRAALLTGRWPPRTGVTDYIGAPQPEEWKRNTRLLPAPYRDRLALEEVTLAERLKAAGYTTWFAGKWHLGPAGWWPEDQGFDYNCGGCDRGGPYGGKKYFSPYDNPRLTDGPPGEYLPLRLARETAQFIERVKDRPFFAYHCFYLVHTPLMAREDLQRKYEEKRQRLELAARWGREHERDVRLVQEHAIYAAMVEAMDEAVGLVLGKLDELGIADRTLVIFTSDNGGLSTSEGWPTANYLLRAGKGWLYEGGIRVPLIVRWPGVTRPGQIVTAPVSSVDLVRTVCDAVGLPAESLRGVDGVSWRHALTDPASVAERPLFWHYPHYGNQGGAPGAAIRLGPWKLIQWFEDGSTELYDLSWDLQETVNLAEREPERVRDLLQRLQAWLREVGAVWPTNNPVWDPSRPSGRAAQRPEPREGRRPNFVLINVDDLGYADIGPFGGIHPTPHLDRMAKEGRLLTSHYAAPVCSPSRAALMTGCYPKRVLPIPHVLFPESVVGLATQEVTIAEVLKDAGYATACIGKWHLGDHPEFLPTRQGFDEYFGLPYSNDMGPASDGSKSNPGQPLPQASPRSRARKERSEDGLRGQDQPPLPWLEGERVIARVGTNEQRQLVRRYTERAMEFIRRNAQRPFFLYLAHSAVHFPLYPSAEFEGRSGHGLLGDWVMEVDASTGQILDLLRELHLAEHTLVIFTSDNGGAVQHGSNNAPLRGAKGSTWEGGVRVPTIAWWPGKIPAGTRTGAITTMMDFLPTFAALAGAKLPPWRRLDGVDIWPVLCGRDGPPPRAVFHYFRGLNLEAVREGRWKLFLKSGELYDLESDLGEQNNVAALHPEVVARLRALAAEMDRDLGISGTGPGVRPLGRVPQPHKWIPEP